LCEKYRRKGIEFDGIPAGRFSLSS
jgi:hypothetical protein